MHGAICACFRQAMDSNTDYAQLQEQVRTLEAQMAALQQRCDELVKENNDIFYKWTKEDIMSIFTERYADVPVELQEKIWNEQWKHEFDKQFPFHLCYEYMLEIMDDIMEKHGIEPQ